MPFVWLLVCLFFSPFSYKFALAGTIWAIVMWFFMISMAAVAGQRRELVVWSLASLPIVISSAFFVSHTPVGPLDVFGRAFVLGSIIFFAALIQRSESVRIKYGAGPYTAFLGICAGHILLLSIFLLFAFFKMKLLFILHSILLPVSFYMIKAMNYKDRQGRWTLPVISAEALLIFLAGYMIFLGLSSKFVKSFDLFISKLLGM